MAVNFIIVDPHSSSFPLNLMMTCCQLYRVVQIKLQHNSPMIMFGMMRFDLPHPCNSNGLKMWVQIETQHFNFRVFYRIDMREALTLYSKFFATISSDK